MFRMTFGTKGPHWKGSHEVTVDMPSTVDEENMPLIMRRYGSLKRLVNRANAMWRVDCATGKKTRTAEEFTAYAEGFCDDGAKDSGPRQTVVKNDGSFSEEQIATLRAANIIVID